MKQIVQIILITALVASISYAFATPQDENIDTKDETGLTPLMYAAQGGETKELQNLLKMGANANIKDQYGWTALMYAIARQDTSTVKVLLSSKADINVRDYRGMTP